MVVVWWNWPHHWIRKGRIRLGKLFAGRKYVRLAASFCVPKCRLCQKLTCTSGPPISEPTLPLDSIRRTDRNGGLCLCRFYSGSYLDLRASFAVRINRVARQAQSPIVDWGQSADSVRRGECNGDLRFARFDSGWKVNCLTALHVYRGRGFSYQISSFYLIGFMNVRNWYLGQFKYI